MKKIKSMFVLSALLLASVWGTQVIAAEPISAEQMKIQQSIEIMDYEKLPTLSSQLMFEFKTKGYIAVRGVPGFKDAYTEFIEVARKFVALSEAEKEKCSPANNNARGWSHGIETFNGQRDSFKGSFFAALPEEHELPNVWPEKFEIFKERYEALGAIMFETGKKILSLLSTVSTDRSLGRMLYYSPIYEGKDDGSPNWCGDHRDHGIFTALCPELFFKDTIPISKPENSGLHILGQEISLSDDVILFQIGEVMELMTNGEVTATNHLVKKAYDGVERFTFALFFDAPDDMILHCNNPEVIKKYEDRFTPDMNFSLWNDRSLAKYSVK